MPLTKKVKQWGKVDALGDTIKKFFASNSTDQKRPKLRRSPNRNVFATL